MPEASPILADVLLLSLAVHLQKQDCSLLKLDTTLLDSWSLRGPVVPPVEQGFETVPIVEYLLGSLGLVD